MYVTCHVGVPHTKPVLLILRQKDLEKETDNAAAAISDKTIVLLDSDGETDEQSTPQSMKVASGIASGTTVVPDPAENSTSALTGTDSIM